MKPIPSTQCSFNTNTATAATIGEDVSDHGNTADVLKFKVNGVIVERDKRNVAKVLDDAKEGDTVAKLYS